ncbi:MAG: T9SS type A sorting domain-containing protein [Chitinophagales bacterium]
MKRSPTYLFLAFLFSFPLTAQTYESGQSYFGENEYIEYKAGNLPIIISAPHGGSLEPSEIPNRSCSGCVYVRDSNTEQLVRQMYDAIFDLFGCYPHVIINRLHRRKLDANREIGDAADGNPLGEQAWRDFHDFIEAAKNTTKQSYGKGLYLDIHGHGHDIQRLELGYRISKSELQLPSSTLNQAVYLNGASIKSLVNDNLNQLQLSDLLQGRDSFGELFEQTNYPAVPSQIDPFPLNQDDYFSGGYNTKIHGSSLGGSIDGIQIECNMDGVRDNASNRADFAEATALVLKQYLEKHYFGEGFLGTDCKLVTDIEENPFSPSMTLQLLPNPVGDELEVHFEAANLLQNPISLSIVNELGQVVLHKSHIKAQSLQIEVEDLPKGWYLLQTKSKDFVNTKPFLKIDY